MIKFERVEAQNFLSYPKLKLDLDNQGLVLIEGENDSDDSFQSNGSGKTSALSAITFAMYGVTLNDTKGDSVINRTAGKNCWVKLYFTSEKDTYRIERYRKDKENKSKVKLFVNDSEITESSNAKTDKTIVRLIGVDFDTYVNAVVYSNNFSNLSFMQATDKGKKEILETLANSSIYTMAQEKSKQLFKDSSSELALATEKLNNVQSQIKSLNDNYNYQYGIYQNDVNKRESAEKQAEQDLSEYHSFVENNATTLQALVDESARLQEAMLNYQSLSNNLNRWKAKLFKSRSEIQYSKQTLANYGNQYKEQQNNLTQLLGSPYCYVCGAKLDAEHLQVEKDKIMNAEKLILDKAKPLKESIIEAVKSYKENLHTFKTDPQFVLPDNVSGKFNEVNSKINSIKDEAVRLKTKADTSKGIFENLNTQEPVLDKVSLDKLKKHEDHLTNSIKSLKENIKGYDTLANDVFSDSGIKSYLMEMITPFINEHANSYLSTLTSGDIQIELETQSETKSGEKREKMDVKVNNVSGAETYEACSAGEKKRIDLAMAFAIQDLLLSQSNLSINVAIYDECFDGLDSIGCENIIEILRKKQEQLGTIYVISHNEHLKPLFGKVMTVVKNSNGDSHIKD